MGRYRRRRTFDPVEYWDSRPYCVVCHERKVRDGDVCWKCRKRAAHDGDDHDESVLTQPDPAAPASVVPPSLPITALSKPSPSSSAPQSDSTSWIGVAVVACIVLLIVVPAMRSAPAPRQYSTPYVRPTLDSQGEVVGRRFYLKPPPARNGDVSVRGHRRDDGTYVAPHYRSPADGWSGNNYSTRGNRNPYTGSSGSRRH